MTTQGDKINKLNLEVELIKKDISISASRYRIVPTVLI